jgi:hypothetical protein
MPTATFAQLCAHLENVSDSSATVFDLYQNVSNDTDPSGIKWFITHEDFMNNFYDRGVFKMRDCCNNIAVLHNWIVEPSGTDLSSAVYVGSDPSNCDLFSLIKEQWILDASYNGCGLDLSGHWGTCSYMNMFRQLIPAGNLCNWDCKVCCALTAKELADVLNYEEYTNNGNVWPTGSVARTNVLPVKLGDCVTLSVRFTNANTCVNPIELRLHFIIDGWMDDWEGITNGNIPGRPQSTPRQGQWSAATISGTVAPGPGSTNMIWIDITNCLQLKTQIPLSVSGFFDSWLLNINGYNNVCPNEIHGRISANFQIVSHSFIAPGPAELIVGLLNTSGTPNWGQNTLTFPTPRMHTFTFTPP